MASTKQSELRYAAMKEQDLTTSSETERYNNLNAVYGSDNTSVNEYMDVNNIEYLNNYITLLDTKDNYQYGMKMLRNTSQGGNVFRTDSDVPVVDADWVSSRFMVSSDDLLELDAYNRYSTTADWKSEDSSWGNSRVLNPYPQFTRYADIRRTNDPDVAKHEHLRGGTKFMATNLGIGRYYSEALADNQQIVYLEFGVPEFNSLLNFFANCVSYEDTYVATYGRYPYEFSLASWVGGWAAFRIYPWYGLIVWGAKQIYKAVAGFSPYNYYYMKPTMTDYWGTVNTIVSSMAVELGFLYPEIDEEDEATKQAAGQVGVKVKFTAEDIDDLKKLIPNLFGKPWSTDSKGKETSTYIDVFRLAATHQIKANNKRKKEAELLSDPNRFSDARSKQLLGAVIGDELPISMWRRDKEHTSSVLPTWVPEILKEAETWVRETFKDTNLYFEDFILSILGGHRGANTSASSWFWDKISKAVHFVNGTDGKTGLGSTASGSREEVVNKTNESITRAQLSDSKTNNSNNDNSDSASEAIGDAARSTLTSDLNSDGTMTVNMTKALGSANAVGVLQNAAQIFDALTRDGALFAGLRVDYTGDISDSFSNSTGPIPTSEMIKSGVGTVRNMKFSLAGGNIVPGLDDALSVVKNVVAGGLDGVTFGLSSVIMSALSGAYIDMPDKWEESNVNLGETSFSMRLVAPYGNSISQLQNIYIPLAMILAGVLPLGTGKSSHVSPYLCKIFSKGICDVELGIISEVSITRGVSNLGFDRWRRPLAIDVSFKVKDLSNIMVAPINRSVFTSFLQDGPAGILGQLVSEGKLDEYIGVLCGRDLYNARMVMPAFLRRMNKAGMRWQQFVNPNEAAMWIGELLNPIVGAMQARDKELNFTDHG